MADLPRGNSRDGRSVTTGRTRPAWKIPKVFRLTSGTTHSLILGASQQTPVNSIGNSRGSCEQARGCPETGNPAKAGQLPTPTETVQCFYSCLPCRPWSRRQSPLSRAGNIDTTFAAREISLAFMPPTPAPRWR